MARTNDGSFLLTGLITPDRYNSLEKNYATLLIRTDAQGNIRWQKTYEPFSGFYGKVVHEAEDGTIHVLVDNQGENGKILKTDPDGNLLNTIENIHATSMLLTEESNYLCTAQGLFLLRADGQISWRKDYTKSADDGVKRFDKVIAVEDGKYLAYGYIFYPQDKFPDNTSDFLMAKVDHEGNLEWELVLDRDDRDTGREVCLVPDGQYMAVGTVQKGFEHQGLALAYIVSPNGELTGTRELRFGTEAFVFPSAIHPIDELRTGLLAVTSAEPIGSSGLKVRFKKFD